MAHDVFISHSTLDKPAADAVCHGLEAKGIRCWIAPRDQIAGKPYGQQITEAIRDARVMVLIFSEHVNTSQAVLNEINLAAAANVTIVPFRIASVEFNPELNYYLGRTHWLDAFPPPLEPYVDALAATIRRNLPESGPDAAPVPPPQPQPAPQPTPQPAPAPQPVPPPRPNHVPLIVFGGIAALVLLVALAAVTQKRSPAQEQASNAISQAVVNAIQEGAKDDEGKPAQGADAQGPQPPHGDGSELAPVAQANPGAVAYYENELQPGGPPAALEGATVINTGQLIQSMRARDAGANPFWLIDARGCTQEPTIPTAVCLGSNSIQELETKAPNKAAQLVVFCHDGACPMSFNLASQAVAAGYANVFWYRGGVNAWAAAGEPTVGQSGSGP